MHCTQCGAEARGRFCAACGASLQSLPCRGCGQEVAAGTRFCTGCGTPVGARSAGLPTGASGGAGAAGGPLLGANLGWWVSGGLMALLFVIVAFAEFSGRNDGALPSSSMAPVPTVDLGSMTPRQAADRLFERVMTAVAREDYVEADSFLPMAISAYDIARPLDDDGLFHLSLLQRAAQEHEASLETALSGLQRNPDHLLNLSAAAEAARELGDLPAAREYYARMLEAWDRELDADRVEYREHERLLPLIREDAEELLGEPS